MDDLAFLRERIESYADYTNDAASVRSDEQIRAYVGEALSGIFARLDLTGAAADPLARVLLRCQFADQSVIRALGAGDISESEIRAIHSADRQLVELAGLAGNVDGPGLVAYVDQVDAALDRRSAIITGADAPTPPAPNR